MEKEILVAQFEVDGFQEFGRKRKRHAAAWDLTAGEFTEVSFS